MRRILRTTWLLIGIAVIATYLLSCLSSYIRPSQLSFISLLALSFPYLFIMAVFCTCTVFFIKKQAAFIALLLVILAGIKNISNSFAFHTAGWDMQKKDTNLRIMTWNIEGFSSLSPAKRQGILNTINKYKPDILCLQEVTNIENVKGRLSFRRELDSMDFKYSIFSNDSVKFIGKKSK